MTATIIAVAIACLFIGALIGAMAMAVAAINRADLTECDRQAQNHWNDY